MSVTLEQLIALNDEVAALVRAGVPLEMGLRQVSSDASGKLRRITSELAAALNRGESLPQALAASEHRFPPAYLAIVEAGLKARSLPRALEAVAGFARTALDLRRQLSLTMIYPTLVVIFAYGLFIAFLVTIQPTWMSVLSGFHFQPTPFLKALEALRTTVRYWGPAIPVVTLIVLIWLHASTWRSALLGGGWLGRSIFHTAHVASFAELMGILVEQNVPLTEALPLAAEATGDRRLKAESMAIVTKLQSGVSLGEALQRTHAFPPVLRWLMQARESSPSLAAALQQAAETYRARAMTRSEWIKLIVPLMLTIVIGGGVTIIYGLTLFVPMTQFMSQLMREG